MLFLQLASLLATSATIVSGAFAPSCTAERRIGVMMNITAGFNEKDPAKSAAMIQAMPLQADCPAIVYVRFLCPSRPEPVGVRDHHHHY